MKTARRKFPDAEQQARAECPGVSLSYAFGSGLQRGADLGNPLFSLLAAVQEAGSIRHAAKSLGFSYRYLWGALKKWEETLGKPLVVWSQGQPARLTDFAERLLWAERRALARMQPHIEALRTELGRVLAEASDERQLLLTVQASHDMALPLLQLHAADLAQLHMELHFQGSTESLRALNEHQCLVAGFHAPALPGAAPTFVKALRPLLRPGMHQMIGCSRRTQGMMMRREHAASVRSFPDLLHSPLRFLHRQPGSGTRLLVDHLMFEHCPDGQSPLQILEHTEETHVAAAACVASGLADASVGIEAAALQFGLHFVPLLDEDYFLVCLKQNHAHPAIERLRTVLASPGWARLLGRLPGYAPASKPGEALSMAAALPWWKLQKPKAGLQDRSSALESA